MVSAGPTHAMTSYLTIASAGPTHTVASANPTHAMASYPYHGISRPYPYHDVLPMPWHQQTLPMPWHQQALPIPWRPTHTMASADPTHTMASAGPTYTMASAGPTHTMVSADPTHTMVSADPTHTMASAGPTHTMTSYPYHGISRPYPYHGVSRPYPYHSVSRLLDPTFVPFSLWQVCSCLTLHRLWVHWTCAGLTCPFVNPFVSVKNKFGYAHPQEYPYRIQNVLECEFFLLEMMVSESAQHFCGFTFSVTCCRCCCWPVCNTWVVSRETGRDQDPSVGY